jgi:hypothetical protein
MEWCRLYANLDDEPRVQAAEAVAEGSAWLLVQAMMYCTAAESGGFIPDTQLPRFGGRDTEQRVKALLSEDLILRVDRGHLIDPDIWNEERNLSDQAAKKKKQDAERQRNKRARDKAAALESGELSREPSRDSHAGLSRDSRVHRRGEESNTPPSPPHSGGNRDRSREHEPRPLWPASVSQEGEGDQKRDQDRSALAARIRGIRPDWSTKSVLKALADPSVAERPWARTAAAFVALAEDPASQHPGRLAHDGPWWATAPGRASPARPAWCGDCDKDTRMVGGRDDLPAKCPACHPSLARPA